MNRLKYWILERLYQEWFQSIDWEYWDKKSESAYAQVWNVEGMIMSRK